MWAVVGIYGQNVTEERLILLGALLKYIDTITDGPSNIDCEIIELLWRMKNALSNHDDVLHELTALSYGELDEEKRRSLSNLSGIVAMMVIRAAWSSIASKRLFSVISL